MHNSGVTMHCRVCGLKQKDAPWGSDGRTPNFEYCPCCGVEFGYGDATIQAAKLWREQWIRHGAGWAIATERPNNWDLQAQLDNVPDDFK